MAVFGLPFAFSNLTNHAKYDIIKLIGGEDYGTRNYTIFYWVSTLQRP